MEMARPARRPKPEGIVPMINVVFLMLIFFLMTAQIAPPDPIEVEPPVAEAEPTATDGATLHLGADATLAFEAFRGEAAIAAAIAEAEALDAPLYIRADKESPAVEIAHMLAAVARLSSVEVRLLTVRE